MIPVVPAPEPPDFATNVRKKGAAFLKGCPKPTQAEWKKHAYWCAALDSLRRAYHDTCAYWAFRIPQVTAATVEHFVPKAKVPGKAYNWANFRLTFGLANSQRGQKAVLDPFKIKEGTFAITFPSVEVVPGPCCANDAALYNQVIETCIALGLNREEVCVAHRLEYLRAYYYDGNGFEWLQREAPFLAREMERQGLVDRCALGAVMNWFTPATDVVARPAECA